MLLSAIHRSRCVLPCVLPSDARPNPGATRQRVAKLEQQMEDVMAQLDELRAPRTEQHDEL